MTYIPGRDFALEASLGNREGYATVNKFGEAIDCDSGIPTDVWDGADGTTSTDIWVPPTVARIHSIVSTSDVDSDTGGAVGQGAGLRTVKVYGLTDWDTAESSETVVMDGTDGTDTTSSYVIIHRIVGLTWGANGVNTGVITAVAATDATVTAAILAGQNQTQMCILGIPSTQRLRITGVCASIVKGTGTTARADGEMLMMTDPATSVGDNTAWTNKENFLLVEGQNPWEHRYSVPKACAGPCIMKIQVTSNTNGTKCVGVFDGYIVDN